jgi:hypothetical protein
VASELPFTTLNGRWAADELSWTGTDDAVWMAASQVPPAANVPDQAPLGGKWRATLNGAGGTVYAFENLSVGFTDTEYWYGTLQAALYNVARSYTGAKVGNVLCLDYDNGVYLDAYGNVVRAGISYGSVAPAGFNNGDTISIQFADTKQVPAEIRGSIDPVANPRMLICRVNSNVTGVLANEFVQAWTGTRRGLAGSMYYPGEDDMGNIAAMPAGPPESLHTAFTSVHWAPNTSAISYSPNSPRFDEVTERGTITYAQAQKGLLLNKGRVKVRVVQKGESNEVWSMDNLSCYVDPIVWYFSNDGGSNFYPAYDIKNDPQGVLAFPERDYAKSFDQNFGQALVWRVVSYAPGSMVTSMVIRPWYAGLLSGITHRLGAFSGDPNVMPYDHYPSMEDDPRFQTWHSPIPQDWWYSYRLINRSKDAATEAPSVLMLPENVVSDRGGIY